MKKIFQFIALMLFVTLGCKQDNTPGTDLARFAAELFSESIDSSRIAGAAILVSKGDEILLKESYGQANLALDVPMPEDAIFEIGSVTKQFTAAAILKLVEQEKLSLEDDFTDYLEFDTRGRTVTISQLLNHTSGIPSYTEMPNFWDLSIQQLDRDTLVRLVEKEDFLFEPGEALIYNNSAYFFLGLIIEKVSGQSYGAFLKEQIFTPLEMKDTHYCSNSTVVANKVNGYNFSPDGLMEKPYLNHTWPYAAGSLCSSTSDLLKWLKALHRQEILNQDQYEAMTIPSTLKDGTPIRYAMGLVNYDNYGHKVIGHGGGIHGFLSESRFFPEEDIYIICLINTTGPDGPGHFVERIGESLTLSIPHESKSLDIELDKLSGTYSGQVRGRVLTVDVNALDDTLELIIGEDHDTISTYIGSHSWMDGNDILIIKNDELRMDNISGYYILTRE